MSCSDVSFMRRALELARNGEGLVEPNPMVGCVLVRDSQIIGEGWHQKFGGPHAEVNALTDCDDASGATAYVTLEPCCHHGKTGPCVEALIEAKLGRVVVGAVDPDPRMSGQGIDRLKSANMAVEVGVCKTEAIDLIRPFTKKTRDGLPWIIAKWAMTLDGKIATATGSSQWISCPGSRQIVHELRGRVDAILVGIGTVLADDPLLTARPKGPREAKRVVMDSMCRIPRGCQMLNTARDTEVVLGVSEDADSASIDAAIAQGCNVKVCRGTSRKTRIYEMLRYLADNGCTNVLVEGGSAVFGALNDGHLIDEIHCFIAPKIAGGEQGLTAFAGSGIQEMNDSKFLKSPLIQQIENDVYVSGRITVQNSASPVIL